MLFLDLVNMLTVDIYKVRQPIILRKLWLKRLEMYDRGDLL
jgi:hypothetical protein